jgi:hypothetical protein
MPHSISGSLLLKIALQHKSQPTPDCAISGEGRGDEANYRDVFSSSLCYTHFNTPSSLIHSSTHPSSTKKTIKRKTIQTILPHPFSDTISSM